MKNLLHYNNGVQIGRLGEISIGSLMLFMS
jgi:hypothetical protein